MNFFKVVSALTLILIIGYVSINQSSGQMGPGQNGCYHNGDFYNVATGPECPSPENENDEYTDPSGNKFTVSHAE